MLQLLSKSMCDQFLSAARLTKPIFLCYASFRSLILGCYLGERAEDFTHLVAVLVVDLSAGGDFSVLLLPR